MVPIVLVPGLLCSAEVFLPQVAALWPFGPVTVASTLEGDSMAAIAAAILRDAPPRFALAGISMGGYLSFEILRQAPERVLRLALLDTSARPDAPEQSERRRALLHRARTEDFATLLAEVSALLFHPSRAQDPLLRDLTVRMGLSVGIEGFARQTEALITRPDSRPMLGGIRVPTLVLVGDSDTMTPPEHAAEIAAAVPGARLVMVSRCGHGSTWEQPGEVNRALCEWLSAGSGWHPTQVSAPAPPAAG
jgi:pimeloyl-ACP methyl ester carboxylesterase